MLAPTNQRQTSFSTVACVSPSRGNKIEIDISYTDISSVALARLDTTTHVHIAYIAHISSYMYRWTMSHMMQTVLQRFSRCHSHLAAEASKKLATSTSIDSWDSISLSQDHWHKVHLVIRWLAGFSRLRTVRAQYTCHSVYHLRKHAWGTMHFKPKMARDKDNALLCHNIQGHLTYFGYGIWRFQCALSCSRRTLRRVVTGSSAMSWCSLPSRSRLDPDASIFCPNLMSFTTPSIGELSYSDVTHDVNGSRFRPIMYVSFVTRRVCDDMFRQGSKMLPSV